MQSTRQKIMLAVGAAAAVGLGVIIAAVLTGRAPAPSGPPPASASGLQVSVNEPRALDPTRTLRCFKDGVPVGDYTLAQCAKMNGVAAQALDVGLDDAGRLAAAPTASLAPPPALPPVQVAAVAPSGAVTAPGTTDVKAAAPTGVLADARGGSACLRYAATEWRQVSDSLPLNSCAQALFAGRCVRPGDALYGRSGDQTLRLVAGRVEVSPDNQHFRTLYEQRRGCDAGAR